MQFPTPLPVAQLAERLGARLLGDTSLVATGINEIHKVQPGDIMFVDNKKYYKPALASAASIILIDNETDCPPGKALLVLDDPFTAYNDLIKAHRPFVPQTTLIDPSAEVHPEAILEPNVVIGPHVTVGAGSYLQSNVVLQSYVHVGEQCIIQSGSILGNDAFYFKNHGDRFEKFRSGGRVLIEDHVDIGAGCTIAKGVSGDTVVGAGSKLDCQVHLGHGVVLGKKCLLAGQVGIGGKTVIGDAVVLYGQVGIAQNLTIGDRAVVLAKSGVSKSLDGGKVYFGSPAGEVKTRYKELAALRHLPAFYKEYYQ